MVKVGDRFKFVPYGDGYVRAQNVVVSRVHHDQDFWCLFRKTNDSEAEFLCEPNEAPGPGTLEPIDAPRAKQHDEISLEEWRQKIRNMR